MSVGRRSRSRRSKPQSSTGLQACRQSRRRWAGAKNPESVEPMMMMMIRAVLVAGLLLLAAVSTRAQLAEPNAFGVAMGHLHYLVRDVDANEKFWVTLGGTARDSPAAHVVAFPDVLIFLSQGSPSGGSNGSVVNHVAFKVRSFAAVEATGLKVTRLAQFAGVGSVTSPEGER